MDQMNVSLCSNKAMLMREKAAIVAKSSVSRKMMTVILDSGRGGGR